MTKLHIDTVGQQGPPLILLHGWGWHSGIWYPLLPELQKKYQVFLVDLPGCGKSGLSMDNYSFEEIGTLLLENLPSHPAIWCGWSLGGLFALWMAIHFPQRVNHLITVASTPRFTQDANWPGIEIKTLEKFSEWLQTDDKKTLSDFLQLQLRGSRQREILFDELKEKLFLSNPPSLPALLGGLTLLRETDFRMELNKISCKSLHVFGHLDTIVPFQKNVEIFESLPNAQVEVFKHTGHMPFLTHPVDFLNLLEHSA